MPGPVSGSEHRATGLASNASSYINAYHTSSCGASDGITQGNRFQTANPTLSVSNVTASSVRLNISSEWDASKDGAWHYGETGGWCSGSIQNQNYTDVTTVAYTTYTFGAFSDAGCHVGVAPSIKFIAKDPSTLTAFDPTATTVGLALTNHDGNWWWQRAGWSECQGPVAISGVTITGLEPNASSHITAYSTSACGVNSELENDVLAQSNRFSTTNPTLTATNVTGESATLTLSSEWDLTDDGNWYYQGHRRASYLLLVRSNRQRGRHFRAEPHHGAIPTRRTFTTVAARNVSDGDRRRDVHQRKDLLGQQPEQEAGAGDHVIGKAWNGSQSIHYTHATSFTTGAATNGYELQSITIDFGQKVGITDFALTIDVVSDDNGVPGDTVEIANSGFSGNRLPSNTTVTYTCSGSCDLSANTTYHLVLSATHGSYNSSFLKWRATSSDSQTGPEGWAIGNDVSRKIAGENATWSANVSSSAGKFKLTLEEK